MHFKTYFADRWDILSLALNKSDPSDEKSRLFVVTAAGIFAGSMIDYDDEGNMLGVDDKPILRLLLEAQEKRADEQKELTGEIGHFFLLDVSFYTYSNLHSPAMTLPFMQLFSDQVIALFAGKMGANPDLKNNG